MTRASLSLMILAVCLVAGVARAQEKVAPPPAAGSGTWKDPKTGLMWAMKDNGSNITQPKAVEYCQNLNLAGFRDWRLPTVAELGAIFDPSLNSGNLLFHGGYYNLHVKGGIQMTGASGWSSSPGNFEKEAEIYSFLNGLRYVALLSHDGSLRALCVRGAAGK